MSAKFPFTLIALTTLALTLFTLISEGTDSPVLGILSLPCSFEPQNCASHQTGFNGTTYIPASYVKWLEAGGARVVPLLADADHGNIRELLSSLNGVLFTGGGAVLNESTSFYYQQVNNILDYLRTYSQQSTLSKHSKQPPNSQTSHNSDDSNDNATNSAIPLWATCLGFESLVTATAKGGVGIMGSYDAEDIALTVNFTDNALSSRIFDSFMDASYSNAVYSKIKIENLTMNNHVHGFKPYLIESDPYLASNFTLLGISYDRENNPFMSLIESKDELGLYWYASQFHPEKPQFEFNGKDKHIPHSMDAVFSNQYFVEFFVNECRLRNNNSMTYESYTNNVIYNYNPYYINKNNTHSYEQVYVFPKPS